MTSGLWACSPSIRILGLISSEQQPYGACVRRMYVTQVTLARECHTGPGAFVESVVSHGTSARYLLSVLSSPLAAGVGRKDCLFFDWLLSHASREGLSVGCCRTDPTELSYLLKSGPTGHLWSKPYVVWVQCCYHGGLSPWSVLFICD